MVAARCTNFGGAVSDNQLRLEQRCIYGGKKQKHTDGEGAMAMLGRYDISFTSTILVLART
jgi:hypothetical protein